MTGLETQLVLTLHIREGTGCFRFLWDPSLKCRSFKDQVWPIPERPCKPDGWEHPDPLIPHNFSQLVPFMHWYKSTLFTHQFLFALSPLQTRYTANGEITSSISCLSEVRILSLFGGYYEVSINEWSGNGSRTLVRKCGWLGNVICSLGLGHVINVGLIYSPNNLIKDILLIQGAVPYTEQSLWIRHNPYI